MKYKNISGQKLTVGNVYGKLSVQPDAEFLTARKYAQVFLDQGLIEEIKEPIKTEKITKGEK